jgi:Lon protease-like protein/uncharacterized protein YdhG (YjbR/CyaY superfamily)
MTPKVREYFARLPPDTRRLLRAMRDAIREASPGAEEGFSYGIPAFTLNGRPFVYYAAFKQHVSIYPMTGRIRRAHSAQLKGYEMSKGTIRFPLDRPLPVGLVKRLVRARAKEVRAIVVMVLALLCAPAAAHAQTQVPSVIPIFPLPDAMLFPSADRPFYIFEPRYRQMVADALKGDRIIGMTLLRPGFEAEYEGRPPIYDVGTAGEIVDYEQLPDGRYAILLRGRAKFRVVSEDQSRAYRLARIELLPDPLPDADLAPLSAVRQRVEMLFLQRLPPNASGPDSSLSDEAYVNVIAQYVDIPEPERQRLLELAGPLARARALLELFER